MLLVVSGFAFFVMLSLISVACFVLISALKSRFGVWAKSYHRLGKRYGAKVYFPLGKPRMTFSYGDAFCTLKHSFSRTRKNRRTQLIAKWGDRRFKLFVSSLRGPNPARMSRQLEEIYVNEPLAGDQFTVFSNQPDVALQLLNPTTTWQIRQLIHHHGNSGIEISIQGGKMRISKPGYIKTFQPLDDFVRFGLELYDQFKLTFNHDIEFVSDQIAAIISEVKCPICSEKIQDEMVVCVRCKTPHCADCWEYNGQCATFACNETRFFRAGSATTNAV